MDNVKCDIAKHLSELGAQFRRYLTETDDTNNCIRYPFHALPPVHLPISEQESLIKIATSGSVKILFKIGSHCQISGLGCAQSILPWQIALLTHCTKAVLV